MKLFSREKTAHEAALDYAERGFQVFPLATRCSSDGKIHKYPLTTHGSHEATVDPDDIDAWWNTYPEALIGITTGCVCHLFAIDIDNETQNNKFLAYCRKLGFDLQETAWEKTPHGYHYIYLYPEQGRMLTNSNNSLFPGVETKGERGHIIISPSSYVIRQNGQSVRLSYQIGGDHEVLELPPPLFERVQKLHALEDEEYSFAQPQPTSGIDEDRLFRLAEKVKYAVQGTRVTTLFKEAVAAGHCIAEGACTEGMATKCLFEAATACGLHTYEDDIAGTIKRGIMYGMRHHIR